MEQADDAEMGNSEDASLGALVERLGQCLFRPPLNEIERIARTIEARLLMSGIEELGVDATTLVRRGMPEAAWLPIFVLLIVTPDSERDGGSLSLDVDGWLAALDLGRLPFDDFEALAAIPDRDLEVGEPALLDIASSEPMDQLTKRALAVLPRWVQSAPIQHVLEMVPPTALELEEVLTPQIDQQAFDSYRWLWERFGRDQFDSWTDESLRLEFKFSEGSWLPPFPQHLLAVDSSKNNALNRELAARSVRGTQEPDAETLLHQLQNQAIGFLKQGRHSEAAALFEFFIHLHSDHLMAKNNLAFCLMPTDPESALHHFEGISIDGVATPTIVAHNICTLLASLGRHAEALDRAEYHWQRGREVQMHSAYLWREDLEGMSLFYETNLELEFARLGYRIAESIESIPRMRRWSERTDQLQQRANAAPES